MKNILFLLLVLFTVTSCCDPKELELNGRVREFNYYGLADKEEIRNDSIKYEISNGSVFFAVLTCETLALPVYILGWNLYELVSVKPEYRK